MSGVELITQERERQISQEGWTPEHDDQHTNGELRDAGIAYAIACDFRVADSARCYWPWENAWWKPSEDHIRNLVKAGALIAAEIDRLQRLAPKPIHFHINEKLDELKSGQWWLWSCTANMSDGTEREGSVQSDGHMIAEETWQEDDV